MIVLNSNLIKTTIKFKFNLLIQMSSFLTNYEHKRTLPNDSSTTKFSLNQMDISQHPNYSNY